MSDEDEGSYARPSLFGVVEAGKPLSRAVWTASRELADDMLRNVASDARLGLWEATKVEGSA